MAFFSQISDKSSAQLTTTLRQKSSWICLSTSFSLLCVYPQALICTVSWNQWMSCQTWVWTSQVFLSLLTWSNKQVAVSSYGTEKEGQKSSGLFFSLSTSCGLLGWPSQGLARSGQNVSYNHESQQFVFCCLFYHHAHLNVQSGTKLEIWDLLL